MSLLERIDREIVLADGAMGTLLIERGADPGSCLEALCLESPEIVAQIHSDYATAGAKIIRTNSFRANSLHLGKFRLGHHVNEINWQAAQIARQAVKGLGVTVAGSVGPIGDPELSDAEKSALFRTQIGALLDGGAQMIFLETFQDLGELILALEVKYSLHHCPAVCSMAFDRSGRLPDGTTIAEAFDELRRNDAEIVGMNCSNGPSELIALLKSGIPTEPPLAVLPNACLPELVGGRASYSLTTEDFASAAVTISSLGPRIIGGCCGTTPAHIAAAAKALKSI
ncbi:MAG: hypothetical protein D4R65_03605 [Verrucomicrobiaceae bacterium]|nr:MAG: hypothetical protein D4R65_03605 [Verrucomicrobiaceae bacterium]